MLRRRRQGTGASPGGPGTDRRPEVAPPVTSGARNSGLWCSSQGPGPSPALLPLNTRLVGSIHGRLAGRGWPLCPAAQLPLTWHPLEHPSHLGMAAGSSLRGLPPTWPASSGAV